MNSLLTFGVAFMLLAPAAKDAPKKEQPPSIVGEWECVGFVGAGQVAPADMLPTLILEFTADGKFRGMEGAKAYPDGTYAIDSTKKPAEVDYAAGKTAKPNHGIYKVEKDILTICVTENGGARPKEFDSPAGTRIMILTFKRVEKKK